MLAVYEYFISLWGLTEGQKFGSELGYVPLPETIVQRAIAMLDKIEAM